MNGRLLGATLIALLAVSFSPVTRAQTPVSEDFTGATTNNQWFFFNGACLTAGKTAVSGNVGQSTTDTSGNSVYTFPGCVSIASSYYNEALVGGADGYLGATSAPSTPDSGTPDPVGNGALRFTNGHPGGYHQNGAIVSADTFPTGQGVQVTFKTVTYRGDSGGSGGDGADGMSFYLIDGCMPLAGGTVPSTCLKSGDPTKYANPVYGAVGNTFPGIGAWGGSLAYSCSNTNTPYDGLTGAYLGLGIDEFGNFLNGTVNTFGTTTGATGDNTASGGGYLWNRIGLRGAGNVSWLGLTTAYGTDPGSSTNPYYPASLAQTCSSGTYDSSRSTCVSCSSGTYDQSSGMCVNTNACSSGSNYVSSGPDAGMCESCPSGYSFSAASGLCRKSSNTKSPTLSSTVPQSPGSGGTLYSLLAVQKTCSTGELWNYGTPSSPTDAGATALPATNPVNTAGILDYAAIKGPPGAPAYSVLPSGTKIANESATTRADAVPIVYSLKITQDGLLSFSYSVNGGALQEVIRNQNITSTNGPLPSSFRFGFAGSTGGDTNVHEMLCFKAQPNNLSSSSAGVNEKQSAKVQTGTFAYFAFYDPDNWIGRVTANQLDIDDDGNLFVASSPAWDASCVLTGLTAGEACSTGATGPLAAQSPSSRTILTWSGTAGIPFEWTSLSTAEQSALDSGDASQSANRLNYLRGDRTNEVDSSSTCPAAPGLPCFRARDSLLGDIVDSSPTWVGPPSSPYTATWRDRLYPSATPPENSGSQTYLQFVSAEQTRANVVYVGANDGMLHGFRSGAFNSEGGFTTATTANDGEELIAYVPGASISGAVATSGTTSTSVVDTIHGTDPTNSNAVTTNLDYASPQYGHNYFVDATPGTGDLFYDGKWHTWLVGGLGAGGAAIYALDISDPTQFKESNASSLVIGEWTAATITCANVTGNCGNNLGNTYGTPQIRRLHNGLWGVIFGNGFGSQTGDAGIFVMTVAADGTETFYYLSTGVSGGNGIAYATPADLDGDHVADYVYAGDLKGNVWRFDLTSNDPSKWGITRCLDASCTTTSAKPLFTTKSGQPITTQLLVASGQTAEGAQTLVLSFGTGQKTPFTNADATKYVAGTTQSLYGVWDWSLAYWNTISSAQYAALTPSATGLSATNGYTFAQTNLQQQTFTINSTNGDRDITSNATVCWQGTMACSTGTNDQFGWYVNLPGGSAQGEEQIVFNPLLLGGAFVVNSTIPPNNTLLSCTTSTETGYTYAVSVLSGGAFTNFFPLYNDTIAAGVKTDASGTSFPVETGSGQNWLVFQTYLPGKTPPSPLQVNVPNNVKGRRVTWIELR